MYPITENVRALFEKKQRQTVEVKVELKEGSVADDFSITETDIVMGSFSIDRYCTSGENIEIGSAIASELKFTLDNSNGKFDNVTLGGAKLFVRLGIKDWSNSEAAMNYMDCGYFTVDEEPRPLTQISVAALDNMMRFDRPVNWDKIVFPITPKALLDISCDACDVTLSTEFNFSALPNSSYVIKARPSTTDITYRQLIQWIAELTGTCAYIDWKGYLRFQWYENTSVKITPSNRYSSVVNDSITITGVQVTQDENTVYLDGEEGYVFNIEGNELIQDNYLEIAQNLGAVLCGFSYVPFECSCFPMPYLYPLDIVSFTDVKGNVFNTMVTAHVYTLNGASNMKAVGETQQQKGYSTSNPFTRRESLIIKQFQKNNATNLNRVEQETLDLNKALVNALGLYDTIKKHDDGSVTYYYHSKPTLEECVEGDVIFCLNAEGFAVSTSGWKNGKPTFTGGLEAKSGKAIWQYLSAHKISADLIEAGVIKSVEGASSDTTFDLNDGEFKQVAEDAEIGEKISCRLRNGELRFEFEYDGMRYVTALTYAGLNVFRIPTTGNTNLPIPIANISNFTDINGGPSSAFVELYLLRPLAIDYGGTGATDTATARSNLGLKNAATKDVKTASSVSALGWTNQTDGDANVPAISKIAYWNGAYSGTSSNLAYCNKGAFGEMATKNYSENLSNQNSSYVQLGNVLIQYGTITVDMQLNTTVNDTVNFQKAFSKVPVVSLTVNTGAPNVKFATVQARTTSSFTLSHICTAYAGNTSVSWIAIGSA